MAGNLTYAQLKAVWLSAAKGTKYSTNPWASLMAAIAEAESGGRPEALNPNDNGGTQSSWGLWQISNGTHNPPSGNWNNPVVNAQLAIQKLNGQGLGAWGTYNSGAYRAFLNGATTPDGTGISGGDAVTGATLTAAATGAACLWSIGGSHVNLFFGLGPSVPSYCVLTTSQARAVAGVALMGGGALMMAVGSQVAAVLLAVRGTEAGVNLILGASGKASKAGKAGGILSGLGGGGGAAEVAEVAAVA
jgi:hypothetical protein